MRLVKQQVWRGTPAKRGDVAAARRRNSNCQDNDSPTARGGSTFGDFLSSARQRRTTNEHHLRSRARVAA
jgi:hypothetical protein